MCRECRVAATEVAQRYCAQHNGSERNTQVEKFATKLKLPKKKKQKCEKLKLHAGSNGCISSNSRHTRRQSAKQTGIKEPEIGIQNFGISDYNFIVFYFGF